jgi:hypothetical protein
MLAVNNNRDDVSWVTSYPPYVTIELTVRSTEVRRKAGVGTGTWDRNFQGRKFRAYMDVLVACPGCQYPPQRPLPVE